MNLNTLRTGTLAALCALGTLMAAASNANAQDPRRGYNVGVGAGGTDMWTQAMSGLRLFTPHRNNCDDTTTPTEVFIKVYTNSNNVDFGFCMDKDEHSAGAKQWEDARKECLDDGKRLPEPGEFKYACDSVSGLNNMTDDPEWSGNFTILLKGSSNTGIAAPYNGNGSCNKGASTWVTSATGAVTPYAFRCVR